MRRWHINTLFWFVMIGWFAFLCYSTFVQGRIEWTLLIVTAIFLEITTRLRKYFLREYDAAHRQYQYQEVDVEKDYEVAYYEVDNYDDSEQY